jgi:hypothetical protein
VADIIGDGREAWWWLPSVANMASVTTAEFTAGIRISQWMSFNDPKLRFKKQDGVDTVYNTLTQDTVGYLVRRNSFLAASTVLSAQKLETYKVICSLRARIDQDDNQPERYEIPVKLLDPPNLNAVVA